MAAKSPISLLPLESLPSIVPGSDLAALILEAAEREEIAIADGDIVVVAQKIVSKAENRFRRLAEVDPSERARQLAEASSKDPRLVELILQEASRLVRSSTNLLIVEHRLGHVMANAGIDRSNLDADPHDEGIVLLLPEDPDLSARQLRHRLSRSTGKRLGVIVSDSFGRPWRMGTVGVAIGVAGPASLLDRRGEPDLHGRPLQVTEVAQADAIAAAAVLVMGEAGEGRPVVIVRGLAWEESDQGASALLRPAEKDLFR